jgi:heme/copper-type cytochrome/quinol oxidase subunit 2
VAVAGAAAALVLGPASPAAADAGPAPAQAPAVRSDGGDRAALWVAGEVVVLVGGAGAARAWSYRRDRRRRQEQGLDAGPAGNGTHPVAGDGRPAPARIRL